LLIDIPTVRKRIMAFVTALNVYTYTMYMYWASCIVLYNVVLL